MKKVTKKELFDLIQEQSSVIQKLSETVSAHHTDIMRIEKVLDVKFCEPETCAPEPKLKQLDQSVFDGLDEKWKSAATNTDGKAYLHNMPKSMMYFNHSSYGWCSKDYDAHEMQLIGDGFDPSGFAIGFIERDIAKELLEVDLSSELTGSDLARAMLARGDKYVLCHLSQTSEKSAKDVLGIAIGYDHSGFRVQRHNRWHYAVPINNQGEPLTQSGVGL